MRSIFVLLMLIALCPAFSTAQAQKLYPVDEAAKDPGFFTFRARLIQAVQKRNSTYLISILSPKISNSFGGDGGIQEFKQTWRPERAQSPVWSELAAALSLGGTFGKDGSFAAPYTFSLYPEDRDVFESGVIIGEGVRLRSAPAMNASVIRTLSFDLVDLVSDQTKRTARNEREWIKVKLSDGQTGYVAAEFFRSPIDYRAVFEKENGRWVMTAFIAGD